LLFQLLTAVSGSPFRLLFGVGTAANRTVVMLISAADFSKDPCPAGLAGGFGADMG
jgi:hypothetical protein